MLMSTERKFIFIEVPKTGTSTVAKRLLEIDPTLERDMLYLPDGTKERVASTHISAAEVRRRLGPMADEYCFVGFLRDPVDQLVSKYYYYKVGRVREWLRSGKITAKLATRHASTRVLPLNIWILLYPYKGAAHFVLDDQGQVCIDIIGNFHRLEEHFREIFRRFGYPDEALKLEKVNVSKYSHRNGKMFEWASDLSLKMHARRDVELYAKLPQDGSLFVRPGANMVSPP
ncbi:sulfotransferase family 2 domain-containing protein [Mameliella alba]|nr:sulfotransferase family 2 domain-containing protein [Antarctobacter heliothermus]MBY6144521.1 sulfotransferase family 2 domain-containing protein [Mameliella alba]MBY6160048.1 sulfotransferase family 2 domain-containing protein [Mameliella alba]MBY6168518.1 sulfotransferase family 2 domain-containing protein [Mameliella alba]MBY6174261.1 sulfotransferase family 2 domain-containing protein [Mameliella alba]